ncbi:MAG: 30S ribosomal protein S19 [Phycisphaerae bacterium]
MARSLKKGPYVDEVLFQRAVRARDAGSHAPLKVWNRACTIVPEFVGMHFEVHNGKGFAKVYVTEDMVGHKLGEFSPTRQFKGHTTRQVKAAGTE